MTGTSADLKSRLLHGDRLVGALVRMPAEEIVEMLALAGLDFVIIDCEHGPADVGALRHHIALAQLHGMGVLVRIGGGEHALALRVLDQGAQGVVAPHIDSREDAEALVRAVQYPPVGERGFATYPRAGRFGTVDPEAHRRSALDATLVVAMLESPGATRNAGDILGTPGIDAYLIGAADLRASSVQTDPALADALRIIHDAAAASSTARADLVSGPETARAALDDGAQMVIYNLTQVMMTLFQQLRAVVSGPTARGAGSRSVTRSRSASTD